MQSSTNSTGRRLATAAILGAGSAVLMVGTAHADGLFGAGVGAGGAGTAEDQHTGSVVLTGSATPVQTKLTVLETAQGAADHATDHLLKTYCIQQGVPVDPNETYDEKGWQNDDTKIGIDVQHLEGIRWILDNSFPQKTDLAALAASVNTLTPGAITTPLTAQEAVEATQAAIWNLADASGNTKLDDKSAANDANVIAFYKYLQSAALGHMSDSGTPQLSLGISPSTVSNATAGDKIGPFTLTSSDSKTKFVNVVFDVDKGTAPPAGSKIVDAGGNEVTPGTMLKSGDKVWVQIPDGAAAGHIVLRASGMLPQMDVGRVFVTHDGKASQNLIVAASQNVYVRDYVDVSWKAQEVAPGGTSSTPPATTPSTTPAATPSTSPASPTTPALAHTGAGNTVPLAGGAVALVAAGGGLVVYTRRTRKASSH